MPTVVAFVSQKGGVGKSTLARALAAVTAYAKLRVLVADLDHQQQTIMHWHDVRRAARKGRGVEVAACRDVAHALELGATHDLLIIDTAGSINRGTLRIATAAHLVVLPTGPSLDDLHPTVLTLHELARAGIAKDQLCVALCRVLSREEETAARTFIEAAGYAVLPGAIPERLAYRVAHNRGRAVTETDHAASNRRADALIEALLAKLAAHPADAGALRTARKGRP